MLNTRLVGIFIVIVLFVSVSSCMRGEEPTLNPDGEAGRISQPDVEPATEPPQPSMTVTVPLTPAPWLEDASIYSDERIGFELGLPPDWHMGDLPPDVLEDIFEQSSGYSITATSWLPEGPGRDGIPEGGSKIDIVVYKEGIHTIEEAIADRKQEFERAGMDQVIISEEKWIVNGIPIIRLQVESMFGESAEAVTAINGHMIILGGLGDFELFDQIVSTIRLSTQ